MPARLEACALLDRLGLSGAGYAAPMNGGDGVGFNADELVSPASVMKIQVALAVEHAIAVATVDGTEARPLSPERRTPGPTGISLMRDTVSMSVRDLVVAMLTISDNVATDELINLVGLDAINQLTRTIGLKQTQISADLQTTLDAIAGEAGFASYAAMINHDPDTMAEPSAQQLEAAVHGSAALDPARGTRTTAAETVRLLQVIWTDQAAPPQACASVRHAMGRQLTRNRIASAFNPPVTVAAKSGGLLGVVRNEAGVVTFPDGSAYAVAVFTRRPPDNHTDPADIDTTIGTIAGTLIDQLRTT